MAPEYDEAEFLGLLLNYCGERILREHPGATGIPGCHVNRCPRCGRIVVTPQARAVHVVPL